MSDSRTWGSTVMGWLIVREGEAGDEAAAVQVRADVPSEMTPVPREPGPNVFLSEPPPATGGEVDFAAVFAALGQVKPGRHIEVRRADGRTAVYTVDRVKVFDKTRFPDQEVYGRARRPELHLITCGGLYTRRTGYSSNIVVFSHLTSTK